MPSADFCPPIDQPLGCSSTRQVDRSPRVRRVTFRPSPPHIHRLVPDDFGLRTPTLPHPPDDASHAVRVPRARRLPSASFRFHLAVDTLAVRLGVPVIRASKGLSPSSHFPAGFRLPVASARQGATRHAWRTPGRHDTLLRRTPLRTVHDSFPSHRSSLSKAKRGPVSREQSRVAFAIRICSRRTSLSARRQSMASHFEDAEDAPTDGCAAIVICFSSYPRFCTLSYDERPVGRRPTFVSGNV